jgi:hypothetical protein
LVASQSGLMSAGACTAPRSATALSRAGESWLGSALCRSWLTWVTTDSAWVQKACTAGSLEPPEAAALVLEPVAALELGAAAELEAGAGGPAASSPDPPQAVSRRRVAVAVRPAVSRVAGARMPTTLAAGLTTGLRRRALACPP